MTKGTRFDLMERGGSVYIMTNKKKTTIYTGVTSDIISRVQEHKSNLLAKSFTSRYKLYYLIYLENFATIDEAIVREKYIKGKSRKWKDELISQQNPGWDDMSAEILSW